MRTDICKTQQHTPPQQHQARLSTDMDTAHSPPLTSLALLPASLSHSSIASRACNGVASSGHQPHKTHNMSRYASSRACPTPTPLNVIPQLPIPFDTPSNFDAIEKQNPTSCFKTCGANLHNLANMRGDQRPATHCGASTSTHRSTANFLQARMLTLATGQTATAFDRHAVQHSHSPCSTTPTKPHENHPDKVCCKQTLHADTSMTQHTGAKKRATPLPPAHTEQQARLQQPEWIQTDLSA